MPNASSLLDADGLWPSGGLVRAVEATHRAVGSGCSSQRVSDSGHRAGSKCQSAFQRRLRAKDAPDIDRGLCNELCPGWGILAFS